MSNRAIIVFDVFQILAARHAIFGMPMQATQEAKRSAMKARAAQKKKKSADEQGPSFSKRPRLEMEEAVRGPKARLTVSVCITPELMVMIKVEIHYLHLASIYYTDSLIY